MGRSFESYALRKSVLAAVRSAIDSWLRDRGLAPSSARRPDALHSDDFYRVVLFHNVDWTIVLTSRPFQQDGKELESVLSHLDSPLLKMWVYDSDLWGYELRVDGWLCAAYNSNPHYSGVATDQLLPKNGDPEQLAMALEMPDLARKVKEIQVGRSLFAEFRAEKFASALGALPMALETEMVPFHLRDDVTLTTGGFQVVVMDYAKPRGAMRLLDLHLDYSSGAGNRYSFNDMPGVDPEVIRQIERAQRFFRVIAFAFKPVFWLAGLVIRPLIKAAAARSLGDVGGRTGGELSRLMTDLQALAVPAMRQEGPWVVNPHHGYRVQGKMNPDATEISVPGLIFCLKLVEGAVNCTQMPPEQVRGILTQVVVRGGDDVKHFVGDYQARTIYMTLPAPLNVTTVQTLLRLDEALLLFTGSFKDSETQQLRKAWDEMINSFEVTTR